MPTPARAHEPPLAESLAYFLTWGTYGTWLPGDERGWVEYHKGWQLPDAVHKHESEARMTAEACRLDAEQRSVVEQQIAETCKVRGWKLHAVNCRSNHVHVVVTADVAPQVVRNQLKAWCTRRLKELDGIRRPGQPPRDHWWAERGSQRYINDEESLEAAIRYVRDLQDGCRYG